MLRPSYGLKFLFVLDLFLAFKLDCLVNCSRFTFTVIYNSRMFNFCTLVHLEHFSFSCVGSAVGFSF